MQYNIFFSTKQIKDGVFSNIKRGLTMYKILDKVFKNHSIFGATILKTVGFYEGVQEKSHMMSIITSLNRDEMLALCQEIRAEFNQDSVLLQIVSENLLIYADKIETL